MTAKVYAFPSGEEIKTNIRQKQKIRAICKLVFGYSFRITPEFKAPAI